MRKDQMFRSKTERKQLIRHVIDQHILSFGDPLNFSRFAQFGEHRP
jgi:hypothetical protein